MRIASEDGRDEMTVFSAVVDADARLALALAAGRMAVWDYDVASDRISGSPDLWRLFGFPPEAQPTTEEIRARYCPGERERVQAEGRAAMSRGERFVESEIRHRWPDGSVHWALLRAEAFLDEAGRPARALGVVMDITERKRDEETLRAEQARLSLAKTAAGFGVWDWDRVTDTVTWSPEVFDLLGLAREQRGVPGFRTWIRALHPGDRSCASKQVQEAVKRGLPFAIDFRLRRSSGLTERWIRSQGAPVAGNDGSATRYVGINFEVTDEHRREERLLVLAGDLREAAARAERERQHIADLSNDLFAVIGSDDEITAYNTAWSTLLGNDTRDLRGARFSELLCADDRREAERALTDVRAGKALRRFEARLSRSDRVVVWIGWAVAAEGGTVYAVGRDVTNEKARDAALAQAQKMEALGQLTGGVAHDFNNLLQAVSGYLEMIGRKPGDAARVAHWAKNALLASERGTKLTGQLLAFSRAQTIEISAISAATMLSDLKDILERTLGSSVIVEVEVPAADLGMLVDRTQLETALINLAVNARDAMPTGGRLAITMGPAIDPLTAQIPRGDYVEIAVTDTGTGMPPDVAARAFDPFFTTKGVGKGTGLGLSQVYGMARHAGGTATIESRPGDGTKVTILLPRAPVVTEALEDSRSEDVRQVTANILVVDDDAEVRSLLADMLPALGYAPKFEVNGPGALAAIDREMPDLVLMDFAMPGMNGAEVAREISLRSPEAKIVFASGYADTEQIHKAVGPEAKLLRKPYRMGELAHALKAALA